MEHFAANDTISKITSEIADVKPFARSATIVAAVCAIIFSIIGVLGKNVVHIDFLNHFFCIEWF